jgi:glycosyltransferase involved in cell wall biosynthesis
VGKTTKYLIRLGHDVRVICAGDHPLDQTLPVEIPKEKILYTSWIDVNHRVKFLLIGKKRSSEALVQEKLIFDNAKGFSHKSASLFKALTNIPDNRTGWIPYALNSSSSIIKEWHPDIIYASALPVSVHFIAHILAKKYHIPWIAEFRDLWVDNFNYPYPRFRKKFDGWLERKILSNAVGFVTVSEPLAEILRKKYKKPVLVVMNGADIEDFESSPAISNETILKIIHTGNIYGGKRDPAPLFKALKLAEINHDQIRVEFYGRGSDPIIRISEDHGVDHMVKHKGTVPYRDALKLQQEADVLLLLSWNDPADKGAYTGKLFEYIASGRPILFTGLDDDVVAKIIQERNLGFVSNNPAAIASQLKVWLQQKKGGGIPATPKDALQGLTRRDQTEKLTMFLETILASNKQN